MNNEHDQYFGVIGEQYDERDYLVTDDVVIPRALKGTDSYVKNGETQYNQLKGGKYSCTVHGAMGAYSDLTGYIFTEEEQKEIWQMALDRGANPNLGWYINKAVALVREWVNEHCPIKVDYYRLDVASFDFLAVMRLGYSPIVGFRGSQLHSEDKADGILDNVSFSKTVYSHCLRCNWSLFDEYDRIVDNYPYKKINVYKVPTRNWKKLIENNIFFKSAYIYLVKD